MLLDGRTPVAKSAASALAWEVCGCRCLMLGWRGEVGTSR